MQRDSGLCQPCAKSGAVSAGQEVNYIDPKAQVKRPGWTGEQMDARENLQAICRACHAAKAARETRGLLAHLCPDRLSQGLNAAGRAFTKRSIQLAECFGVASHSVKTVF
ncbi:HNH endonuclease [Comamonas sp. lk]|uniref:HNH endonuclease n=1 Tax=Comamonas sp. lk TaxID=2201272 RepID=UPI000EAD8A69|nr:HNH endonuclease [Comamonas sp. lk]